MKDEIIVISLGGSMIIPDQLDLDFLKDFKALILSHVSQGKKFLIITGGGKICRRYQEGAKQISEISKDDLDWIGIAALRLNAELMRSIFGDQAYSKVVYNLEDKIETDAPIIIGAAYKPGQSTDWDAVLGAKNIGAKTVINLSNIDYVYDSDPKINPKAKKVEQISWQEYRKIIPEEWYPGLNTPFDPMASKAAEENNIKVVIMNGRPIDNLAKYLNGESFKGTTIS